jgi:hypothetical protein
MKVNPKRHTNLNSVIKYGSFIVGIAGLFISIVGLHSKGEIKEYLFIILFCSYIVGLINGIVTYLIIRNSREEISSCRKLAEFTNNLNKEIIMFNKDIVKKTNTYISTIFLRDKAYLRMIKRLEKNAGKMELIPTGDLSAFAKEIATCNDDYIRELFYSYNTYIKRIVDDTKKILEKQLEIKKYKLRVSVTLKLLDKILENENNDSRVITAFRDSDTYHENKREIGKTDYTIAGNMDFATCLHEENFIKNNAKKEDRDYTNEHTDFDQYYNCTITVPIYSNYGTQKKFFGYLCCDVLNKEYENATIFDVNDANILSSSAFNVAMFFENINNSWRNMLGEHESIDFNNYIHIYFVGKRRN